MHPTFLPFLRRLVLTLGAAVLTAAAPTVLLTPTASAGIPGPTSPLPAPAVVEQPAPYVGQAVCDPVAKPGTVALAQMVLAYYRTGRNGGIVRDCAIGAQSEHKEGRAWDWMLNSGDPAEAAVARSFLDWLAAPGPSGEDAYDARRLGVMYVIWDRRIWSPGGAWEPYTGPNPHTDHIHISLSWAGAMKITSWWTGVAARVDQGPCTPEPTSGGTPRCPPGQQQPRPSRASAAVPQEAAPTPHGTAESDALAQLAGLRGQSLARIALDGRWVAQLASKGVGVTDPMQTAQNGTHTFTAVDILAESRAALATVHDPAAVLVLQGTDFGRRSTAANGDPHWITLTDVGFDSRAAVEAWCAATYPQLSRSELTDSCVPRRLLAPHD